MKIRFTSSPFIPHVLAALLLCANASAADVASDAAFNNAMAHYRDGKLAGAYGRFAALADQGHPEAARIALVMLRHGAKLYGHDWGASQSQIDHWMKLALQEDGRTEVRVRRLNAQGRPPRSRSGSEGRGTHICWNRCR